MKRKRKCLAAAVLSLMMVTAAGCGTGQSENPETAASSANAGTDTDQQEQDQPETGENTADTSGEDTATAKKDAGQHQSGEGNGNEAGGDSSKDSGSSDKNSIGGKVRSVSQDSFVLSRTLWIDSEDGQGSYIVMPEPGSAEEELVTVRFADSVVFVQWTIHSDGSYDQKDDVSFSDVQEGTTLEAEGHYDGDEFVADKVIIEFDD